MKERVTARFEQEFHKKPCRFFRAPGRTELGGNHTDHQHGRVLAAAVELFAWAAVAPRNDGRVRVASEGYPVFEMQLGQTEAVPAERGTPLSLVRGIAAGLAAYGTAKQGADIAVCSAVPVGSGLSSSASFEMLMAAALSDICFEQKHAPVTLAAIAQRAENEYFGKPCGLMDQLTCAVGGAVGIDFADAAEPAVEKLEFSLPGYTLCIVDSGADHAGLTASYAAIPADLQSVSAYFGKNYLREVDEVAFRAALPALRTAVGERAVLRAMHVFAENSRVGLQISALRSGNSAEFLELVNASGRSSWMYLQNVVSGEASQKLAFAIAFCAQLLGGRGACRVHGGGFAGTLQAFVPDDMLEEFICETEAALGSGCCRCLNIAAHGAGKAEG